MKRLLCIPLFLQMTFSVYAQKDYYIFLQSEVADQPFYARLGGHTYGAAAGGHIILAPLADSTYEVIIGFPHNQFPEQHFMIPVHQKDHGFALEKTGNNGWRLLDLGTGQWLSPIDKYGFNAQALTFETTRKTDPFSVLLANVVNDSAVLYTVVPVKKPAPLARVPGPMAKDSSRLLLRDSSRAVASAMATDSGEARKAVPDSSLAVAQKLTGSKNIADSSRAPADSLQKTGPETASLTVPDSSVRAPAKTAGPVHQRSRIAKLKEEEFDYIGRWMVYTDAINNGEVDTIKLLIPFARPKENIVEVDTAGQMTAKTRPAAAGKDKVKRLVAMPDTLMRDTAQAAGGAAADTAMTRSTGPAVTMDTAVARSAGPAATVDPSASAADSSGAGRQKKPAAVRADCPNEATAHDVDKLRVRMLREGAAGDRIGVALKVFREICFSSRQVRALSELFDTDEERFKFFQAAYPFISDTGNFYRAVDVFTDPVYIAKFKAMAGH